MRNPTRFFCGIAGILLISNPLLNSGCSHFGGPVAPAGTVAFADGELDASLANRYETVAAAASRAIPQVGLGLPDETKDSSSDTFLTHTAKGDHVSIVVTQANDNLTTVAIRVDAVNAEQFSHSILDRITANL